MKRTTEITLINILFLLLLGGCTEADILGDGSSGNQPGGKRVEAAFSLQVMPGKVPVTRSITLTSQGSVVSDTLAMGTPGGEPGSGLLADSPIAMVSDTLHTRAGTEPETDQERTISNVWVGQYDATSGALLSHNYISSVPADNKVTLELVPSGNCHIRFVTNAGDLGTTASTAIQTESGLKGYKLASATADGNLPGNLCIMTGLWQKTIVPPTGIAETDPVSLTRVSAKITFQYTINGTARFSFTPTSVSVQNAPDLSQLEAPTGQLPGIQYSSYTFPVTDQTKTIVCYLPENMAGNGDAVASLKERTGAGVQNATNIILSGDAVQDGVTYTNVSICFYPGDPAKLNNYDILRNGHYTMNIKLGGLDMTDKRITIGEIPQIGTIPNLPAAKGGTQKVQITTRPGTEWIFDLPVWLSAKLPGKTIPTDSITVPAGSKLSYKGPVNINFKVEESNPRAEVREISFDVPLGDAAETTDQLTLTQEGSVLTVPGGDAPTPVTLDAAAGSTGTFSFTATKGLPWDALFSSDWLDWSGTPALGNETTGAEETYTIAASQLNPSVNPRTMGTITVRAGASVSDPNYAGLRKEIPVTQAGATVQATAVSVPPNPQTDLTATFTATPGLPWTATGDTPWIEIITPSGGPTVEGSNTVTFNTTELNLSAVPRTGQITVSAGGQADSPSGVINVRQEPFELHVTAPTAPILNDGGSVTGTITATEGLPWTISPATSNDITVSLVSGSGSAGLTFTAPAHTGLPRVGTFTLAVTGADPARTVQIQVVQGVAVVIDQALADAYKAKQPDLTKYPPFNSDGGEVRETQGSDRPGTNSATATIDTPYFIEVSMTQPADGYRYDNSAALTECTRLGSVWRLPTIIEYFSMYQNKTELEAILGFSPFIGGWYWSSSVHNDTVNERSELSFNGGNININGNTTRSNYIRCVREII